MTSSLSYTYIPHQNSTYVAYDINQPISVYVSYTPAYMYVFPESLQITPYKQVYTYIIQCTCTTCIYLLAMHTHAVCSSTTGQEPPKPLRLLQKIEKPVPRPPTPTCPAPGSGVEEREQAIILLQRVLRGRSKQAKVSTHTICPYTCVYKCTQNVYKAVLRVCEHSFFSLPSKLCNGQLYAGKEQRADLIRELRTTHALQSPELGQKRREKEEILSKQAHKLVP